MAAPADGPPTPHQTFAMPPVESSPAAPRRARWLKGLLTVHWISSAICLLGLLLFSVTGLTLNHASQIEARPDTQRSARQLPAALLADMQQHRQQGRSNRGPLPAALNHWLAVSLALDTTEAQAEWSAEEVYLPLPRPGGDAWLRIDLTDGALEYERTDRGWIAWLNDLHKGRHTGEAWRWLLDGLALGCVLFAVTGLLILQVHARQRVSTWPLVALGVLVPLLIVLLCLP